MEISTTSDYGNAVGLVSYTVGDRMARILLIGLAGDSGCQIAALGLHEALVRARK